MSIFRKLILLLAGSLLIHPLMHAQQPQPEMRLGWGLSNEKEFFKEIRSGGATDHRHFELDTVKAETEGIARCQKQADDGKKPSTYCRGLAARLAPVFDFRFATESPKTMILERIEVECFRAYRHRGPGYLREIAYYDLLLPTQPGIHPFAPEHQLTFSGTGLLKLRLWPDFRSGEADTVDLAIRFHFASGEQAGTGRFTLRL